MAIKKCKYILFLFSCYIYAQQDAQYTQYMYNTVAINPAYAGSRNCISIFGLHRNQWIGFDGAPVTNSASLNMPIENSNLGVGLSFINDKIGPTVENNMATDLSYSIRLSKSYKLALGLKGTLNTFNLDVSQLNPQYIEDPLLQNFKNKLSFNVGSGLYLYSDKTYVGLSIPYFFVNNRYDDNEVAVYKEQFQWYFMGGSVFELNPNIKLKPAFLIKSAQGSPLQIDVSGNFLFYDQFTLGTAWRSSNVMSFLTGVQINQSLFIGYGYDLENTKLSRYNSGSHEFFLRFELFSKSSKIVSPRFF